MPILNFEPIILVTRLTKQALQGLSKFIPKVSVGAPRMGIVEGTHLTVSRVHYTGVRTRNRYSETWSHAKPQKVPRGQVW